MSTITFTGFPTPSQHHGQTRIEALITLVQRGLARNVPSAVVAPTIAANLEPQSNPTRLGIWFAKRRQANADAITWSLAQSDHRLMAELSLARSMGD